MKHLRGPARYPLLISVVVIVLFLIGWLLLKDVHIPVLMPSGQIAKQQKNLIIFTVALALIVVVPVFTLLAVFAFKYRDGQRVKRRYDPEWAENKKLEMIWWGIPIAIISLLSVVTYITSHSLDPYKPIASNQKTLEIEVVALQWKWLFLYPEQKVATVNELTIPAGRPVHFRLTADAPMSAFWIPDLGSQIYNMNAMSSQLNLIADRPGTFKGYNTNINGDGYAHMKFDVHAVSSEQFDDWSATHQTSGHKLDETHFHELAKPSLMSAPMYMQLQDSGLYDRVIMKYMGHGGESDGGRANMHEGRGH